LIICPETRKPAAVEVDAKYAALIAPISARGLRLKDCSRWPDAAEFEIDMESAPNKKKNWCENNYDTDDAHVHSSRNPEALEAALQSLFMYRRSRGTAEDQAENHQK
jgi:hypothetical protein